MTLTDTHCHIQEAWRAVNGEDATRKLWAKAGDPKAGDILGRAVEADVTRLLCVGTTLEDSKLAVEFVQHASQVVGSLARAGQKMRLDTTFFASEAPESLLPGSRAGQPSVRLKATIGLHPHVAERYAGDKAALASFAALTDSPEVAAIGECGLDYFYNNSPSKEQEAVLRFQIELALEKGLPMVFHVRDAFDDFWPIFDSYKGITGVIHSFSATKKELDQILGRGLFVGLNGIMTFTKNADQLAAARAVPLEKMVLETDAPFLTPAPYRGTICEPRHVRVTAEFLAGLRGESLEAIANATTQNAHTLFGV